MRTLSQARRHKRQTLGRFHLGKHKVSFLGVSLRMRARISRTSVLAGSVRSVHYVDYLKHPTLSNNEAATWPWSEDVRPGS